jgi:hypothetical protein
MLTLRTIQSIALSFPDTDEQLHYDPASNEIRSFRVHKKTFATLNLQMKRCTLKFDKEFQDIFVTLGKGKIYAVPNAWGRYGWTTIELKDMKKEFFKDTLLIAWRCVAPKKYTKQYPEWYKDEE